MKSEILYTALVLMGLAAFHPCAAADAAPDIQTHPSGSGYVITFTSAAVINVPAAQAALISVAQKLCAGKAPQFGHYKFNAKAPLSAADKDQGAKTSFTIDQDITCVDSVPQVVKAAPTDPNWQPTDKDYRAAIDTVTKYFAAKDSGDVAATYALLDGGMGLSTKEWKSSSDDFAAQAGPVVSHKVMKLTWYKDPQDAPQPGIYAAADFVDHYQKATVCGYLSLHQRSDGAFLVIHEQDGFLPNSSNLSAAQLAEYKTKLGCVGDEAEPLPETKSNTIGYPSVDAARKALLARKDAESQTENGWLIVTIESEKTIWSFAPKSDPAYPAAVERIITSDSNGSYVSMNVLCEASKAACDNLVRQFQALNDKIRESLAH